MPERHYQAKLIKRLRAEFDGCLILKNDSQYMQGIPDLIILHGPYWAMLEIKADADAAFQPNQAYWISELNHMGYASFIYPEIEDEVFRDLQRTLEPRRTARPAKRQ